MTISQGLVKVVFGSKGNTTYKWWRISRRKMDSLFWYLIKQPNLYYAKIFHYQRLGKRKGIVGNQIAYIYQKDGVWLLKYT